MCWLPGEGEEEVVKAKAWEYIRTHIEGDNLNLEMPKKDLAFYLSMQPETLTRNFKKLEDTGSIKKINNKTYEVIDI